MLEEGQAAPVAAPAACAPLTLHCRGVSSMMASGVGLAEPCPTSVGPKTRDRLRTSILHSGLRDTLRGDRVGTWLGCRVPTSTCGEGWSPAALT